MNERRYPRGSFKLIGAALGSGKTIVSYRPAGHFNVGVIGVDAFQVILNGSLKNILGWHST